MATASTTPSACTLSTLNTPTTALHSASPGRVGLPLLPPALPARAQSTRKSVGYCHKSSRNVIAMAVGETTLTSPEPTAVETIVREEPTVEETEAAAPEETTVEKTLTPEETVAATATEVPEIVNVIKNAWDKVEDKYAVSSLAVAGVVGLVGTAGFISAVDQIPVLPGLFEVVGIGYTGWFAFRNLVYKNKREALFAKIKSTYEDIIGTSS